MATVTLTLRGETVTIERDEWQIVHGSRTPERAAEFFGVPFAAAIVERLPDDARWPGEPVWRVMYIMAT